MSEKKEKHVSAITQERREIEHLKRELDKHVKFSRLQRKKEALRSLLIDVNDLRAGRINAFDVEQTYRDLLTRHRRV